MNNFTFRFKPLVVAALASMPLFGMAQFTGDENTNFGQFGHYQYSGSDDETLMDIVVTEQTNTTYLAGYSDGTNEDGLLIAVWQNGSIDNTFANGGVFQFDPQIGGDDRFNTVELQSNARIVVGGSTSTGDADFLIARILSDGTIDAGFNGTGYHIIDGAFGGDDEVADIELLSSGKILAVGLTEVQGGERAWAVMLNSDGTLDTNFGNSGSLELNMGGTNERAVVAKELPSGAIIIGALSDLDTKLVQITSDGTLDNTFSVDGETTVSLDDQTVITSILPLSNGNILISGTTVSVTDGYEGFAQVITDNGNVSLSFANGGWTSDVDAVTNAQDTGFIAYDLVELENGQYLLGGNMLMGQTSDVTLALLNADGTLDMNFGTNGYRSYDLGAGGNEINAQISFLDNGQVMLGTTTNDGDVDFLVYNLDAVAVSVNEVGELSSNANIYPNPAVDNLTIELDVDKATTIQLSIVDATGRIVQQPLQFNLQEGSQTIDLSAEVQALSAGMYFIQCANETSSTTLSFLKR